VTTRDARGPDADARKQAAIDLHTRKAEAFASRYRAFAEDPYASAFAYGRKKIQELIERATADLPRGTLALDAGCGTGFDLARLCRRGFAAVGLEPSPAMRERARAAAPQAEIVDGDIEAMPFAAGRFGLVIAIEVLRYLPEPARALREVARVLRPGGLAVVTAAPLFSLGGYPLLHVITSRVKVPTFERLEQSFMTARSARRTAGEAGFSSVEVHGAFLGPWYALERISRAALTRAVRIAEPLDDRLSDRWPLRDLTNHLVIVARR
jgi:SAM-dependent methyltransferase